MTEVAPNIAAPQVRFVPLGDLVPYARNSLRHPQAQIDFVVRLIENFGFTNPVLADGEGIVAGHGRVLAAKALYAQGKTIKLPNGNDVPAGTVPVLDCSGWDEAKRRAYIIADNQSARAYGVDWDPDLLPLEVSELKLAGFDLSLLGFGDQLTDLLDPGITGPPDKDPDDAPPAPAVPHSQTGDIWVLGAHRVMCGSATEGADWAALMAGEQADAVWTDPPYNVAYDGPSAGKIKNDNMGGKEFREFLTAAFTGLAGVMKPGAAIYVAHSDTEGLNFRSAFVSAGFKLAGCLIWRKDSMVLGRSDFQWQHEPILYGWKPGSAHRWYGGRKQTTVAQWGNVDPVSQQPDGRWQITVGNQALIVAGDALIEEVVPSVFNEPRPKRSAEHPTMKPVNLIERQIKNNARTGDLVVDAFGGSGSTLIAADRLGMSARLMELDPKFVDVIVQRWQDYTGHRAVHAQTGAQFPAAGPVAEAA